tara:strand:+ start:549 stop:755 length:207 start_codon:yes stop_codon:yes gene_type:complete
MPTHYNSKKKPKTRVKKNNGELTQRQKDTLKRHSKHHSKKHIKEMSDLMKKGKTFGESHKIAMKKVGK